MAENFASPFMYWVGVNFLNVDAADMIEINRYYEDVHQQEVVRRNGFKFAHHYELLQQSADVRSTLSGGQGEKARHAYEKTERTVLHRGSPMPWIQTAILMGSPDFL